MALSLTDSQLLDVFHQDDVTLVTLRVLRLDGNNDRQFLRGFADVAAASRLVLDLSVLALVDGKGIAALLQAVRWVRSFQGELKLCGVRGDVRRLFERMLLHRSIDIYHTPEQAISAFHV